MLSPSRRGLKPNAPVTVRDCGIGYYVVPFAKGTETFNLFKWLGIFVVVTMLSPSRRGLKPLPKRIREIRGCGYYVVPFAKGTETVILPHYKAPRHELLCCPLREGD